MKQLQLQLIALEDRHQPATFGIPWADNSITMSFVPDGTTIAGRTSNLFDGLARNQSVPEWQGDIVRAYQTWARHADLHIAVVPDSGDRLGVPGRLQNDPRFGDIRIAGNALSTDVLAITSPPDPVFSGTLAGDVFVNTTFDFNGNPYDLQTVMLHEAGHSLGLDHSSNPESPMFPTFNNTKSTLTTADIQAIRLLYGARRADRFEGPAGNSTPNTARPIPVPTGYNGSTPLLLLGELSSSTDVDTYSFWNLNNTIDDDDENITIRWQSTGLSLLSAKVTVFYRDTTGSLVEVANATSSPDDWDGDTLEVTFDGNSSEGMRRYFVRVERSDGTEFDFGRYALAVSFEGNNTVPVEQLERVITGPYQNLTANDLARLLQDPDAALVNRDFGTNNIRTRAQLLPRTHGTLNHARHEAIGSLETATDIDFYRLTMPNQAASRVLTVHTALLGNTEARPNLQLLNTSGLSVPAEILVNDNGNYTLQAKNLIPGATYFIRVSNANPASTGNYLLTADVTRLASQVVTFASGSLTNSTRQDTVYIGETQKFHFALTNQGGPGSQVQMNLLDATGNLLTTIVAPAGSTISVPSILLTPGEYRVIFSSMGSSSFTLRGNRITDPVGPVIEDTTLQPSYRDTDNPNRFRYPGNIISLSPYYWLVILI